MAETQGRGPYYDEARIERAAKRAHEDGGGDGAIYSAATQEFNSTASDLIDQIRSAMRRLFGS